MSISEDWMDARSPWVCFKKGCFHACWCS